MLSNKVSEIMAKEVITADASHTISAVIEMMAAKNVGGVIIAENQRPVGIFTEQDVLKRVINKRLDPRKNPIRRVMTSPIQTVKKETHIIEALGKMYQRKFRHLLVRGEKGEIAGMVSMRDILRLAVELGRDLTENQTVGSIMSSLTTVDGSHAISETVEVMTKKNTGCVVVEIAGEPKGVFTERDVLKRVALQDLDTRTTPIREVMTAPFIAMDQSVLIGEVMAQMSRRGFRNMPIHGEGGRLAGIVSLGDVLQYARALDVDEAVRRTWKEIEEFWDSEEHYTPG